MNAQNERTYIRVRTVYMIKPALSAAFARRILTFFCHEEAEYDLATYYIYELEVYCFISRFFCIITSPVN